MFVKSFFLRTPGSASNKISLFIDYVDTSYAVQSTLDFFLFFFCMFFLIVFYFPCTSLWSLWSVNPRPRSPEALFSL